MVMIYANQLPTAIIKQISWPGLQRHRGPEITVPSAKLCPNQIKLYGIGS